MTEVTTESKVTLHYTLTTSDGLLADTTKGEDPETVEMGQGDMVDGLEKRLIGLKVGDKQRFEVPCMETFGPIDEDMVHDIARSEFPEDLGLELGLVVNFAAPNGEETPGIVAEIGDDMVKVDFNHPLAGYDLIFDVEIIAIESPATH